MIRNCRYFTYFVFTAFVMLGFVSSILAKRLAGNGISGATHFLSSRL